VRSVMCSTPWIVKITVYLVVQVFAGVPIAGAAAPDGRLLELATKQFGQLNDADRILFARVAAGEDAKLGDTAPESDVPSTWPDKQRLRADRLQWLCTEPEAIKRVKTHGINVIGAGIEGDLDLHFAQVPFPLSLRRCAIPSRRVDLRYCRVAAFDLRGSRLMGIDAEGIRTVGALSMGDGFRATERIGLRNATIGGNVIFGGGHFEYGEGDEPIAIDIDGISIDGNLVFGGDENAHDHNNASARRFESRGRVTAMAAQIRGDIRCGNAFFSSPRSRSVPAKVPRSPTAQVQDDEESISDSLSLAGVHVGGNVTVAKGFEAHGKVDLLDAVVGLGIDFSNGSFENPKGESLSMSRAVVGGDVFLMDKFESHGEVTLQGASIGGQFACNGATFINPAPRAAALRADETNIKQGIFLRGIRVRGHIRFLGAVIGGNAELHGAHINNFDTTFDKLALTFDLARIKGNVFLLKQDDAPGADNQFEAKGTVRFIGARIEGNLECDHARFDNPNGEAVWMSNIEVKGTLSFQHSVARGRMNLSAASVQGALLCDDATFDCPTREAVIMTNVKVSGDVSFQRAEAHGQINLAAASVQGALLCDDATFDNPRAEVTRLSNTSLATDGGTVGTAINARHLTVQQDASFNQALICGTLSLESAQINGQLLITNIRQPQRHALDLSFASLKRLVDDEDSWPRSGNLVLKGLEYKEIEFQSADYKYKKLLAHQGDRTTRNRRIAWLELQALESDDSGERKRLPPQPFTQLAKVLTEKGQKEDARKVMVQKEWDAYSAYPTLVDTPRWLLNRMYWATVGYGYSPWWAIFWVTGMILIGRRIFRRGFDRGLFAPAKTEASGGSVVTVPHSYPKFNALVYSLETLVPFLTLRQNEYWLPNANAGQEVRIGFVRFTLGARLRWYLWFHILVGWVLASALVAGVSGLLAP
jgi:hypothetical protein